MSPGKAHRGLGSSPRARQAGPLVGVVGARVSDVRSVSKTDARLGLPPWAQLLRSARLPSNFASRSVALAVRIRNSPYTPTQLFAHPFKQRLPKTKLCVGCHKVVILASTAGGSSKSRLKRAHARTR